MNRRGFFGALSAVAAAPWLPRVDMYSIAPLAPYIRIGDTVIPEMAKTIALLEPSEYPLRVLTNAMAEPQFHTHRDVMESLEPALHKVK